MLAAARLTSLVVMFGIPFLIAASLSYSSLEYFFIAWLGGALVLSSLTAWIEKNTP